MTVLKSRLLSKLSNVTHAFPNPQNEPPVGYARLHQVHSGEIVPLVDQSGDEMRVLKADGIITHTERAIAVQTGDCLPALFATRDGSMVAAVHAGWRGVHKGILVNAVEQFKRKGVLANDLFVAIGPAIGRCCFEVSPETINHFEKDWNHLWHTQDQKPWQKGQPPSASLGRSQAPVSSNDLWLDLDLIARLQLVAAGVPEAHIEDVGHCTYCGPGEFASYRRGTHEGHAAGRQWSWIQRC